MYCNIKTLYIKIYYFEVGMKYLAFSASKPLIRFFILCHIVTRNDIFKTEIRRNTSGIFFVTVFVLLSHDVFHGHEDFP
jgi:hypothetical protein